MSMDFTIARRMEDGSWWHGHHDAAFNVANATGYAIMRAIGIEPDTCGSIDGADAYARAVAFRAVGDPAEHAVAGFDTRGEAGCRTISMGVPAERIAARMVQFEELARIAAAEGAHVGWS